MPRRVSVPAPLQQQGDPPTPFPQPPDPTGQNRGKRPAEADEGAPAKKPRRPPPKRDDADAEGPDGAAAASRPPTPSLRAGFLPPVPPANRADVGDAEEAKGSRVYGAEEPTDARAAEEENYGEAVGGSAAPAAPALAGPPPPHPHDHRGHGQYGMHHPHYHGYHDSPEPWHDWHGPQNPWHYPPHPGPHYHHQWWGQGYYDDHRRDPQPPPAHHHHRPPGPERCPGYREFAPADEDATRRRDGEYHYHPHPADDPRAHFKPSEPREGPLPPLPGRRRSPEDPDGGSCAKVGEARRTARAQSEGADVAPVYAYSDAFKERSWDEMLALLEHAGEKHPGLDVEGAIPGEGEDADAALLLSSWIREVRWIRRARAPDEEKSPKATRGRADKKTADPAPVHADPLPDCLTLAPHRIRQLDRLRFPWRTDRTSWQKWLDDLLHFRAKNRSARADAEDRADVPLKYAEYPSLGNFVNRQRTEYRKLMQGRSSSMTQNKIADLNAVGFLWSVREGGHTSWDTRLMELRDYRLKNGHCNVPKLYKPNPSLGYWVNEQRFQYRRMINNKPSYMTDAKVAHLNALGFVWTLRESKKPWQEWLAELRAYKEANGHVDVPLKCERNANLGAFVNNQRSEYRKLHKGEPSSMTREKIEDLEALGFRWSVRESRTPWTARLKELKAFKEEFGHVNVPKNWRGNPSLSYWVEKQRQQYKLFGKGPCHLTKERIDDLNKMGFDWKGSPAEEEEVAAALSGEEEGAAEKRAEDDGEVAI